MQNYTSIEMDPGSHNQEAEMAILGNLLEDNENYWKIGDLEQKHFYFQVHQRIYREIERQIKGGEIVTPVSLKAFADAESSLHDLGGIKYIFQCADMSGAGIMKSFIKVVIDLFKRRNLSQEIGGIMSKLENETEAGNTDDILADLFTMCVEHSSDSKAKLSSYRQVTANIISDMQEDLPCYSTGIPALDKCMQGGLYSQKTYCIAAPPKNGKTIMLSTIASNMASCGIPTAYICAEMGENEIHQRVLARQCGTNCIAFIKKRRDADFISKVVDASGKQPDNCFYVDAPAITFEELQHVVMLAIKRHNIKGFFLDYLQLVTGKHRTESKVDHQENVTSWLAKVARDHRVFCLYAAQLKDDGKVRGGMAIEMAVDQLYNMKYDKQTRTAYMSMEATRYTPHLSVGSETKPGLKFNIEGPYFSDIDEQASGIVQ